LTYRKIGQYVKALEPRSQADSINIEYPHGSSII
jgi:hypothetical protein